MDQEFISSIESSNILRDGALFFDEIMVLYNLIGKRSGINISLINNMATCTFNIKFDNPDDCRKFYSSLNNSEYTVYGKRFSIIICIIDELNLGITLVGT